MDDKDKEEDYKKNYNAIISESFDLLDALYTKEKEATQYVSNQEILKNNIMTFISERLKDINKKELLTNLIDAELIRKLLLHEITIKDLMSLRTDLSVDKNSSIQSVLDLFKPTTNTANPLLPPPREKEEEGDITKKLSPEGREVLNKLMLIVSQSLVKDNQKEQEEEEK